MPKPARTRQHIIIHKTPNEGVIYVFHGRKIMKFADFADLEAKQEILQQMNSFFEAHSKTSVNIEVEEATQNSFDVNRYSSGNIIQFNESNFTEDLIKNEGHSDVEENLVIT